MSQELARRAVACKGWRWMPGMRYTLPTTSLHGRWKPGLSQHIMPDLDDPAALGCLLALVREAWGNSKISVHYDGEGEVSCRLGFEARSPPAKWVVSLSWGVDDWSGCVTKGHSTEAEALVAALEAAP